jgi:hypothetical protein
MDQGHYRLSGGPKRDEALFPTVSVQSHRMSAIDENVGDDAPPN